MIRFERRGIMFGEIWFDEPVTQPGLDVIVSRHCGNRPVNGRHTVKLSLLTDLTQSEDHLWSSIHTDCRRKLRRGQEMGFDATPAYRAKSEREVAEFSDFYNRFASEKGIGGTSLDYLLTIAGDDRLWLSAIADGTEILARHAYIATGSIARFLYGGAMFRNTSPERQRKVSHAHRLLHWVDIRAFKDAAFSAYDWGGLFPDEGQPGAKGVNDFKRQFGGKPVEYFESERALTFRGQVYLRSRPAFRAARTAVTKIFGETPSRPSPQKPGAIPEKLALPRPG
jgi:hypothetical protein